MLQYYYNYSSIKSFRHSTTYSSRYNHSSTVSMSIGLCFSSSFITKNQLKLHFLTCDTFPSITSPDFNVNLTIRNLFGLYSSVTGGGGPSGLFPFRGSSFSLSPSDCVNTLYFGKWSDSSDSTSDSLRLSLHSLLTCIDVRLGIISTFFFLTGPSCLFDIISLIISSALSMSVSPSSSNSLLSFRGINSLVGTRLS